MPPKLKYEFVLNEFKKVGYELITKEYVNTVTPIDFICNIGGHINKITWGSFSQGHRCSKCSAKYSLSFYEVVDFYKSLGYLLLSGEQDYKNNESILKYKCNNGHINESTLHTSSRVGYRCSICAGHKLTYEFVKEEFRKLGLTLLETTYADSRSSMRFTCDAKNHSGCMAYDSIRNGSGCAKCAGNMKLSYDEVKTLFKQNGYELLSSSLSYHSSKNKLKYKCNKGHIRKISYPQLQAGYGCSDCKGTISIGVKAIIKYFEDCDNILKYKKEYSYENCRKIKPLRFDFYVNGHFLIEFDGRQHFNEVKFWRNSGDLIIMQKRDIIKTNYCRQNKIPLLRISYKHIKKIPEIIKKFMEDLKENPTLIYFTDDDLYKYLN